MLAVWICMLCAIGSVFYLAPASAFLFNGTEVVVSLGQVFALSLVPQGAVLAAGLALCVVGRRAARTRIATASAALALLVYLQGNALVWDYGRFDGTEVDWEQYEMLGLMEMTLWLGTLVSSQLFASRLVRAAPIVALLAVSFQILAIATELAGGRNWDHATATERDPNLFHFSTEQNVVVLLLDGFQSHSFDAILESFPGLKEPLRGFVYFQDTLAVFPTTLMSIPAILAGEIYDNTIPTQDFLEQTLAETSLPEVLAAKGFESSIVPRAQYCDYFVRSSCTEQLEISHEDEETRRLRDAIKIWDIALFRHVPHSFKRYVYRDHQWLLGRWFSRGQKGSQGHLHARSDDPVVPQPTDRQQASGLLWSMLSQNSVADSEAKTFKFLHFWSSHVPDVVSESCELFDARRHKPVTSRLRSLYQSRCTLLAALEFVNVLTEIGVLDQTLLVILADHGSPATLPSLSRLELTAFDMNRAFPLLLVKPIAASAPFKTTRRPASLADLPRTLAGLLDLDHPFPGQDLFDPAESRERAFFHYLWKTGSWDADYLPPLQEYRVKGYGRDAAAWREGRQLKPGGP